MFPHLRPWLLRCCVILLLWRTQSAEKTDEIGGPVIGIDLGTTYSCVGVFKNGRVEIIPNDQGNRITPSYVAFTDDERLLGEAAKNQATVNPAQTLFDVKRLIGRKFSDPTVKKDSKLLPFGIIEKNGKLAIEVKIKKEKAYLRPEEVSAMVLTKMKETAENYLGKEVNHAVITVPAYFADSQRQSTKDAGTIAGLDVLRIINEPTAAAIAYGLDKKGKEKNILVYDLGGGTFDVSILSIDNGVFEVVATNGDTHLGGSDFDQRVMEHFMKVFKTKTGKDIMKDKRAIQKLRREVEKAKRALSSTHESRVEIEALMDGVDLSETLSRAKFEELNVDLFKSTLDPLKKCLDDSGFKKGQIDDIVLVGGSTRIPKIQSLIKGFFGKEPVRGVNPDEAVAYGAAVQAGIMSGADTSADMVLLDVTPLTLGIETAGGVMSTVVSRNTVIPTKKKQSYVTGDEMNPETNIRIFEGERTMVKDNHPLGDFKLTGFPTGRGQQPHDVTFEIDSNGILQVTAEITSSGESKSLTIQGDKSRLTEDEIEKMMKDAERFAEEDKMAKQAADATTSFDIYLKSTVRAAEGTGQDQKLSAKLTAEDKEELMDAVKEGQSWLDSNPEAAAEDTREKHQEIEGICSSIIRRYAGNDGSDSEEEEETFDEL